MSHRGFTVRALGEIAIRCIDLDRMVAFYRDVIGLEPFNDPDNGRIVFFRISEGFGGHTAVLALFRHDVEGAGRTRGGTMPPGTGPASSLHHIALSLPWDEQDAVIAWYETLGRDYTVETFDWVGWRGVFTFDPDGNTVELVARDPARGDFRHFRMDRISRPEVIEGTSFRSRHVHFDDGVHPVRYA